MADSSQQAADKQSAADLISLADGKREDQGCHECEVWPEGCMEGSYFWDNCQKNPEHKNFTPVQDFTIGHLPEKYHDPNLLECIHLMAKLTVRLRVGYTSIHRPDGYVFSAYKGRFITHVGTGFVDGVCKGNVKSTCPCPQCKKSTVPYKKFWTVVVWTAKHVMFDTLEARHTICDVFYDTVAGECKQLYGVRGARGSLDSDRSWLVCVTHDPHLANTLIKTYEDGKVLRSLAERKFSSLKSEDKEITVKLKTVPDSLVIICSHPHGCTKHISVGECIERHRHSADAEIETRDWSQKVSYTYTNATCLGSSGAMVFVLGRGAGHTVTQNDKNQTKRKYPFSKFDNPFGLIHPHSGCSRGDNQGKSAISSELCEYQRFIDEKQLASIAAAEQWLNQHNVKVKAAKKV